MKKRILSLLLCAALVLPAAAANSGELDQDVLPTLKALEIMVGDGLGNLNLDASVSRAEFAKLLAASSIYKDDLSGQGSGFSLFTDVKSTHWASEYIKLCLDQGWMIGYTDGSFRPDNTVTLEEACTATLRLLGIDSASLAGSFPAAQLNKAKALGLREGVDAVQGQTLTRRDCAQLFYNLLTCQTAQGQIYGVSLGCMLDSDGNLDYQALVEQHLEGPFIADGSLPQLDFTPTTVLKNGTAAQLSDLALYDVYYYNAVSQTLWIYTDRLSGKVEALTPNALSPAAVTVSGQSYALGNDETRRTLSSLNGKWTGRFVTLLFGLDDTVVGVLTDEAVDATYYGVVQAVSKRAEEGAAQRQLTVLCTDGRSHTFSTGLERDYDVGDLVQATITSGQTALAPLTTCYLTGTVNQSGTGVDRYAFADDLEVLDTAEDGTAVEVEPARLGGLTLNSSNVRFYRLNAQGQVDRLILRDATGALWSYGYLAALEHQGGGGFGSSTRYTLLLDGQTKDITVSNASYPVSARQGVAVRMSGSNAIGSMRALQSVALTSVGLTTATASGQTFSLADDLWVYLKDAEGDYHAVELDELELSEYTLSGWYDAAQKELRIIIIQ